MKTNSELHRTIMLAVDLSSATGRMWWIWSNRGGLMLNTGRRDRRLHQKLICRVAGHEIIREWLP